ncbi:unnamed protein product [Vitrella brassicaformis CCMP3155]|uniref:non-specific serine/threonine protein kinase n=2 Tax=Vitrella brassicaformis TaxID=1169539 RepID=A0A0G4EG79_VITBC|nr:unnamed protein product [Vitrella brassicaformis CCMP3155]|mmetsp:Transcript_18778/g.53859  ORF Transcript_18778/g.53859 Transcript_18778/m.53859 type:complete len:553 (-) Transcript_18778:721-2379(-)|eukprot:CEL94458.1 unnamed protein product [Vitrella brassicaformis CCMP3155]
MAASSLNIGPYRLGKTIGEGNFGKVKVAVHEKTGEKVAIKMINKLKMQAMEMHGKLKREINILQQLKHPHVIRLYEVLDTPTHIFIVMEYVPGELFDYILERRRLSEGDARRFFQQIVSGVEYSHQNMVCHRDLKPENVLLDMNLHVKIADFGLSNMMKEGDFLKTSCGSPNYAAPEIVSGKAYAGPEVDVWSCGVLLFAMLCGHLPFDEEGLPNLFKKIRSGRFTLPGHLSELSRSMIIRMLVVDPTRRITFREIRKHAWFRQSLPLYLSVPLADPSHQAVYPDIITQLNELGYDVTEASIDLNPKAGAFPNMETVAYQLLLDKRRAKCTTDPREQDPLAPTVFPPHIQKKVAHLHQKGVLGFEPSPAASPVPPASPVPLVRGWSAQPHTTPTPSIMSYELSPGSVGWSSSRWKLGVESLLDSSTLVVAILQTLKKLDFEWFVVSPFKIRCRPVRRPPTIQEQTPTHAGSSRAAEDLMLTVQLHRIASCRYLVDVQIFQGPSIAVMSQALLVISSIYSALQKIDPDEEKPPITLRRRTLREIQQQELPFRK